MEEVRDRMGEKIDHKVRDFLRVHNRGGQPCPRCGRALTELRANQRITTLLSRLSAGNAAEELSGACSVGGVGMRGKWLRR